MHKELPIMSHRLSIRFDEDMYDRISEVAAMAGYPSPSMLVRCLVVQFLNKREVVARHCSELSEWVDGYAGDELDPRNRAAINGRL